MDFSGNPDVPPPSYVEHGNTSNVPYGQSTLLYGNDNAAPPTKPNDPYAHSVPSQYPDQPGYVPYGAPPYGHPMGPGYPPPGYSEAPPQQQQQSVVVVTAQQRHHPMLIGHVQSYAGHIVMACFVTFCCCFVFGIIAFILASESRQTLLFIFNNVYHFFYSLSPFQIPDNEYIMESKLA